MTREASGYDRRTYIKLNEIEELFGIPSGTVRKWIKRDPSKGVPPLKAFKPGRDIMIERKELENYIKRFPAA